MHYSLPHKIEFAPSQAKWRIESTQSVLVIVGLSQCTKETVGAESIVEHDHDLASQLIALLKKAKALDIPVLDLNPNYFMQNMMLLGEYVSQHRQIMFAGWMNPMAKQVIQHISSIAEQLCIIDDAILLENKAQHIQWINSLAEQGIHHTNVATLKRMWSLSAPTDYVLSDKGILFAIAEQLDLDPMEIDPYQDLRAYGLDSIAMVSLIGLWRANGANISYEDFLASCTLEKLMTLLKYPK